MGVFDHARRNALALDFYSKCLKQGRVPQEIGLHPSLITLGQELYEEEQKAIWHEKVLLSRIASGSRIRTVPKPTRQMNDFSALVSKIQKALWEDGKALVGIRYSPVSEGIKGFDVLRQYIFRGELFTEESHYDSREDAEREETITARKNLESVFPHNYSVFSEMQVMIYLTPLRKVV